MVGVIMALVGNTSAVSFDLTVTPDAASGFVNDYADKIDGFVGSNYEDISTVAMAFKKPYEEYLLRGAAYEEERMGYVLNMVTILAETFLPDVESCDE